MRFLLTVQPSTGHLNPLLAVAETLRDGEHEVAFCSAAPFRPEGERYGFDYHDAGIDWLTSDQSTWTPFGALPPPGPEFAGFAARMFADITTARMVPDLLAIAKDWKPDLIIREGMEYGGCLVAEKLGIPHASVAGNGLGAVDSTQVHYFTGNRLLVAEALDRHRAELGLPPDPNVEMPFRFLHLAFVPPSWSAGAPAPANTTYLCHVNPSCRAAELPGWVDDLPAGPTVFASLGTVFNKTPGVLEAIVEAAHAGDWNAIVAVGPDRDPRSFGPQPDRVRIVEHVPQIALLERCEVFVTHAGFNSVKEALAAGVPMVAIPITADQPYCAERCAALGAATVIGPDHKTAGAIGDAVSEVLADSSYRESARGIQREMLALPGRDHMLGMLEELAATREGPAS